MNFNKKQAPLKRPKNFLFAVISCLLLALAFSAQSVFAKEAPTAPKISASADEYGELAYNGGTDIKLVDDSAATKDGITWEYAVTSTDTVGEPTYGWSTDIPKRNIGDWKVWYCTEGNEQYEALSGSFNVQIGTYGAITEWPTINDDLTYTGKSLSLLSDFGNIDDGHMRFCVTSKDVIITSTNIGNYAWLTNAEATTAGDYHIWVSTFGDGTRFNENGIWDSKSNPIYADGYLPVTIHYDGPRPKLYLYTLNS